MLYLFVLYYDELLVSGRVYIEVVSFVEEYLFHFFSHIYCVLGNLEIQVVSKTMHQIVSQAGDLWPLRHHVVFEC